MSPAPPAEPEIDAAAAAHPLSMRVAAKLVVFMLVCLILWIAKGILVPVALAAFLTFVFAPVVKWLQVRVRLPRMAAIILALGAATAALFAFSWFAYLQLSDLASEFPRHRLNILQKITDIRQMGKDGALAKVSDTIEQINEEVEKIAEREKEIEEDAGRDVSPADDPVEVKVVQDEDALPTARLDALAPVLGFAGTAGLVILLTFFFLFYREDLRNRMLSFAGEARLIVTTRALHDAGRRISRYLFAQALVNAVYGAAAGLGLWALGVPYALLWGLATSLLRYIPYVGAWVGALLPLACSLIISSGWTQPLLVAALFVVLELLSNNLMEPWLYRRSVGLSEVAIILSAVVWAFIWGPVGLVLATPLTVCIVVLGQFVPGLGFLSRLMGSDPAMAPSSHYYHRMASLDTVEAAEILREHKSEHGIEGTIDRVIIPALALAGHDLERGTLPREEADDLADSCLTMAEDVLELGAAAAAPEAQASGSHVIGLPAMDELDAAAVVLFAHARKTCEWKLPEVGILAAEVADLVRSERPAAVCVVAVSHRSFLRARRWCKRLKNDFPSLRIVVGRWTAPGLGEPGVPTAPDGCLLASDPDETWRLLRPWIGLDPDKRAEG